MQFRNWHWLRDRVQRPICSYMVVTENWQVQCTTCIIGTEYFTVNCFSGRSVMRINKKASEIIINHTVLQSGWKVIFQVISRLAWLKRMNLSELQKQRCLLYYSFFTVAKQTVKKQKADLEAITSKLADMETLASNKVWQFELFEFICRYIFSTRHWKFSGLIDGFQAYMYVSSAVDILANKKLQISNTCRILVVCGCYALAWIFMDSLSSLC